MAQHRHKRDTNARKLRALHVAAPLSVVATLSAVTMGVLSATPAPATSDNLLASSLSAAASAPTSEALERRQQIVSRAARREARADARRKARAEARAKAARQARAERRREAAATQRAVANADSHLWTTADLNVWDGSGSGAAKVGLIEAVKKVLVTERRREGRAEIVLGGKARWVSADYLAKDKPETGPSINAAGGCTNGSSIQAGRSTLYKIHEAVCANWPQITSYGTWRSDGEHGQGRAIDIMVSGQTGWEVAEFLRANHSAFGIEYLIYAQKIWSVERAGEGWRGMSDRGSVTANHYDHVHVTVY